METQRNLSSRDDELGASELLSALDGDRAGLAQRLRTPWWLPVGFGLVAAGYIATPLGENPARSGFFIVAIAATIAMAATFRKITGIRAGGVGPIGWLIVAAALVITLVLLSVSFGLVSLNLHWWVIATAAVGFVSVGALTFAFVEVLRARVRHAD